MIPLAKPDIGPREVRAVVDVLESGTLSRGPVVPRFEREFARYCHSAGAVACSSGTAGLQMSLEALQLQPGDEVITVSFTFVASVNAILHAGGTPVFVDIDPESMNVQGSAIEAAVTDRTRAILVVHLFGLPAPMDIVLAVAERHGIAVIEDACEALGATWDGRLVGSLGEAGVFGFYPNKSITTAEGGMIVSNNSDLLSQCRRLRNQGRIKDWEFDPSLPGHNFRLSELHAALGVTQLARLGDFLARRADVAKAYARALRGIAGLKLPPPQYGNGVRAWFAYVIQLPRSHEGIRRERLIAHLHRNGVAAAAYFPPVHLMPYYRRVYGFEPGLLPATEDVARRTLALPFFCSLGSSEISYVAAALRNAMQAVQEDTAASYTRSTRP